MWNKFWVALLMAGVAYTRAKFGIDLGVDEATVTGFVGVVSAGLIWLVPNR